MKKLLMILGITLSLLSLLKILSLTLVFEETDLIYRAISTTRNIKGDFSFVVLGDNKNSISTFNEIIKSINSDRNVSFVINTGDMVFDGNPIKYNFFLRQIKNLTVPMFAVPGNHDVEDHGVENYLKIFGPLYYHFIVGNSCFVILDDSNENRIDPYQMMWLERTLKSCEQFKYKFVFMHVPLFDPRVRNQPGHSLKDVNNAKEVLKILKEHSVTTIFSGHIHGFFEGNWDGVPYVITGGAGAELVGVNPKYYFYHYVKVSVSDKGIKFELIKMKSPDYNIVDRLGALVWLYFYSFVVINYWEIVLFLGLATVTVILILELLKRLKSPERDERL